MCKPVTSLPLPRGRGLSSSQKAAEKVTESQQPSWDLKDNKEFAQSHKTLKQCTDAHGQGDSCPGNSSCWPLLDPDTFPYFQDLSPPTEKPAAEQKSTVEAQELRRSTPFQLLRSLTTWTFPL